MVYEHISGGAYAGQPLEPEVLCEGFAMLRTVVSDLNAAGHKVTVLLDNRLFKLNPPLAADCVVPVFSGEQTKSFLVDKAQISDATYIIAPETGQTLQSLVQLMEKTGKVSLNSQSGAIQNVADKAVLYAALKEKGLPTPKTLVFNVNLSAQRIKQTIKTQLNYPVVFKPSDGVSCAGLCLVKDDTQVEAALSKVKAQSTRQHFIAQEFVKGEAASVSLICADGKAIAISLNKQNVIVATPDSTSSYSGGIVPFEHPLKEEAFKVATLVVEGFSGLRGYIGVDFVLSENGPVVVDVNPRLTTSYVGLSQVACFNVAEAIVEAAVKTKLPPQPKLNGFASFLKLKVSNPTLIDFQETGKIRGVISPPFMVNSLEACMFVSCLGKTLEESLSCCQRIKEHALDIISRGEKFG